MKPKYRNGQKVRIIEVKNPHGNPKYPELQAHINEAGVIIEARGSLVKNLNNTDVPGVYPTYRVRLDKNNIEIEVCEDALMVLE
jgi:hypothetical protein